MSDNNEENKIDPSQYAMDFFFWLGEDGEAVPLTEEEFVSRIAQIKKAHEDWRNVSDDEYEDNRS